MVKEMQTHGDGIGILDGIKNVVLCFSVTAVILFAVSCVAVGVNMPFDAVDLAVCVITYLCVVLCGFRSARRRGSNGLLTGALSGLLYALVLYIVSCVVSSKVFFGTSTALTFLICVLCGAIGGVVGINTNTKRRR